MMKICLYGRVERINIISDFKLHVIEMDSGVNLITSRLLEIIHDDPF